ncbi:hypothetical protein BaRGS_00002960 [Batillaria attramentaria]|uniref:Uncharacterized protein n=1 Tax=Batillaria attramentaria TaxID=370345 RepID=A0ABD0M308_9CAEN
MLSRARVMNVGKASTITPSPHGDGEGEKTVVSVWRNRRVMNGGPKVTSSRTEDGVNNARRVADGSFDCLQTFSTDELCESVVGMKAAGQNE